MTAPTETDSDAADDLVSSSDLESAPPSPAAKARAKRLRQNKAKKEATDLKDSQIRELPSFKDTVITSKALADLPRTMKKTTESRWGTSIEPLGSQYEM